MAKLTEKRLYEVPPQLFTVDGDQFGKVTIADTRLFVVGQIVIIKSAAAESINLKVKRITSFTEMYVGPIQSPIQTRYDISAYLVADGASVSAAEQPRPTVPEQEIERNTYAEEPTVARRVVLVDPNGNMIDDDNPLSVSAVINVDTLDIALDAKGGDNIAVSAHPAPIFSDSSSSITGSGFVQVFSYTSTNINTKIVNVVVSAETAINVVLKINGIKRREYRTNFMDRQASFVFYEHRPLSTGSTLTIEVEPEKFYSNNAPYTVFTALEGYIA